MLSEQLPEVVEVFTGDSLEEAMAFAVAALGPDLSVRRARKVRKGVQGLVGKDRYEVVAAPPPGAPSTDAVASAFDALLDQAEQAETPVRRDPRPRSPHPAPSVAEHAPVVEPVRPRVQRAARELPAAPEAAPARARRTTTRPAAAVPPPPPAPAPVPTAPTAPSAPARAASTRAASTKATSSKATKATSTKATSTKATPTKAASTRTATLEAAPAKAPRATRKAAAAVVPARRKEAVPAGWSRGALVALGLPEAVLQALPAEDPLDDLAWVVALAVAISTVLPAPAALGPEHPLVVHGYGTQGVLGLLDAAARGLTPGTITVGDRTAPATATELALAVRTAVVG